MSLFALPRKVRIRVRLKVKVKENVAFLSILETLEGMWVFTTIVVVVGE